MWFNSQVAQLIEAHRQHVASIEALHNTLELQAMTNLAELKTAHARELNRVIEENQKLRDDADRLRLLLTPALQNVELPKERTAPPSPVEETITGTPWQRVLKKAIVDQERAAKVRFTKDAEAPDGVGGEKIRKTDGAVASGS